MESRISRTLLAVACAFTVSVFSSTLNARTDQIKLVPYDVADEVHNSFIFVFKDDVKADEVNGKANLLARSQGGRVTHTYKHSIKGFSAKMPPHAAARMAKNNPNIAFYEKDGVVFATPPKEGRGKPGNSDGNEVCTPPWGVERVSGGDYAVGDTAWVIDTGIDLDHPDLNVSTDKNISFVPPRGKKDNDPTPEDGNGHGTHVAGTIAAKDNGCDLVGVAAGATVVAVKVLDDRGSGSYSGVIAGVDYVADKATAGDVANMSLGGGYSGGLNLAVEKAASLGIAFVVAAGNSSDDASLYSPASAEGPNIYTVSAFDRNDKFASFSNYGSPVDYAAPGVSIFSTWKNGGTNTISGTSMAAPHVAGLLLLSGYDQTTEQFNSLSTDGVVSGDPDKEDDPICVN